jgi:L-fuculose-phosphate aldolase
MKAFSLLHPRDQIVAIMERIYAHEMTTTSGGNISVRDENGDVWITPARVDKGSLRRQDIVRISPNGDLDGTHPPSSESPFHLRIYDVRPDLHAVIHAHPSALVSFSICGQVPDTRLFPEAWQVCGPVAFAPYALPGSIKLGARIAEQCGSKLRPNCVVLENHGVVVGGENLARACMCLAPCSANRPRRRPRSRSRSFNVVGNRRDSRIHRSRGRERRRGRPIWLSPIV